MTHALLKSLYGVIYPLIYFKIFLYFNGHWLFSDQGNQYNLITHCNHTWCMSSLIFFSTLFINMIRVCRVPSQHRCFKNRESWWECANGKFKVRWWRVETAVVIKIRPFITTNISFQPFPNYLGWLINCHSYVSKF